MVAKWGKGSLEEEFWKHIDKNGPIPTHCPELGPCWIWNGSVGKTGRGVFAAQHSKQIIVPRFSYQLHKGPIPDGLNVCHHCDNPNCPNPDHLFAGTQEDNLRDAQRKGRVRHGERKSQAKLTTKDVREIISLRQSTNLSYREIGERFGICNQHAQRLVTGKSWAHLHV